MQDTTVIQAPLTKQAIVQMFREGAFEAIENNASQNETELEDYITDYEDDTGNAVYYPPGRQLERGVELEDPAFVAWLKEQVTDKAEGIAELILESLQNDELLLWRAVVAPADWNPHTSHIGCAWSFDQEKAQPIFGNEGAGDQVFVIEARVPLSSIDWDSTLSANLSEEFGDEEDEVTLLEDGPYRIEQVYLMMGNGQLKPLPTATFKPAAAMATSA
jgi:hypothetical protein